MLELSWLGARSKEEQPILQNYWSKPAEILFGFRSMSGSAHAIHMRSGVKFGNAELKDTMLTDGLTDAFSNIHMGITAENIAKEANYR